MTDQDPVERMAQRIRTLTIPELRDWVSARLRGYDEVGGMQGEAPHELIAELYTTTEHAVSVNLQRAVHALIDDLAMQPEAWPLPAAVDLLMLIDPVLKSSPRRVDLTETLLSLIRQSNTDVGPALAFAAAQALLTLEVKVPANLWISLYRDNSWAPIVVEGLLRTDINTLQTWMAEHLNPDVEDAFINLLPMIIDGPGSEVAAQLITGIGHLFSRDGREELLVIAEMLGIGEARSVPDIELVNTLSGTLHLVAKLLRDTNPSEFTHGVIEAFQRNFASVRGTLLRQTDLGSIPNATLEELWTIYIDCLDHALVYPPLARVCVHELTSVLPAPLLRRVVVHMLTERGFEKSELLVILRENGTLDVNDDLDGIETQHAASFTTRLPFDLRDEVITELWRRDEERRARDLLLAMQAAAFAEGAWGAFK